MQSSNSKSGSFLRVGAPQPQPKGKSRVDYSDGVKMKIVAGNLTAGRLGAVVGVVEKGVFVPFFVEAPAKGKLEVRAIKPHVLKAALASDTVAVMYMFTLFDAVRYNLVVRVRQSGAGELVSPLSRQLPIIKGPRRHLEQIAKWFEMSVGEVSNSGISPIGRDPFDGNQGKRMDAVQRAKQRDSSVLNDLGQGGFDSLGLIWEKAVFSAVFALQANEFLMAATETAALPTYHLASDRRPLTHVADKLAAALELQRKQPVTGTPQATLTAAQTVALTDDIPPAPPIPKFVKPLAEATDEELVAPLGNSTHVAPADLAPDPVSEPVAGTPATALEPDPVPAPAEPAQANKLVAGMDLTVWKNVTQDESTFWTGLVMSVLSKDGATDFQAVSDMVHDWYDNWVQSGGLQLSVKPKGLQDVRQRAAWAHPMLGVAMILTQDETPDKVFEDDRLASEMEKIMERPIVEGVSTNDLIRLLKPSATTA